MNVLILGGSGYLGSKIVRRLIQSGHTVICTKRASSNINRLEDLSKKIVWIPATIDGVQAISQVYSFDVVLNMVCNYGRSTYLYDDVIAANVEFPLETLNYVTERGTKKFLTMGTGLPDDLNMYSYSKKMFSDFGRFFVAKHNIMFYDLKLQMFYGSDEPKNRFLPSLIHHMLSGEDVDTTVGTQRRDIIAVNDIVNAIVAVLDSDLPGYQEIEIGTGVAPTISEIVDFIQAETNTTSVINKGAVPLRPNEPDCIADTGKLRELCDWHPLYWQDGLRQMIKDIANTL